MAYWGRRPIYGLTLCLVLCVSNARANPDWGLRIGGIHASTELEDRPGFGLFGFIRQKVLSRYQVEFGAGYQRLRGTDYATDVLVGEGRLLYGLGQGRHWSAHLYSGAGLLRYALASSPPETTPDAAAAGWGAITPIGLGFQRSLGPDKSLDLHFGYTYTMRDDLNRAILKKGNDVIWTLSIGLVFGEIEDRVPRFQLPQQQVPSSESEARSDRDGDGLSDRDEQLLYFTNPIMADSDGDGLNDREEIEIYGTNPNRLDSDNGGVRDGSEIARGANPLDPGDDFVPSTILEEEPLLITEPAQSSLPTIFFPTGGTVLIRESRDDLNDVATYLLRHPDVPLELHGHSDSVGSRAINLQLSRQRAETVKDYLIGLNIDARRLKIRALGESRPIESNASEKGRRKNRRVELVIP